MNYFTASVVAASTKSASINPNDVKCELCEENQATDYCKDCSVYFCGACKKPHLKLKVTAHHQFISIDEALKGGSSTVPRVVHCQKHPHLEVNSYCKTDQTAVCPQCAIDYHNGHDVDLLNNISQGFKDTISTLVNKVCFFFIFFFSLCSSQPIPFF